VNRQTDAAMAGFNFYIGKAVRVIEPASQQDLTDLEQIELDLLREVERTRAEFHGSLNGSRDTAADGFEKALRIFNDFILNHQLPLR
jgi:hypothetical protein